MHVFCRFPNVTTCWPKFRPKISDFWDLLGYGPQKERISNVQDVCVSSCKLSRQSVAPSRRYLSPETEKERKNYSRFTHTSVAFAGQQTVGFYYYGAKILSKIWNVWVWRNNVTDYRRMAHAIRRTWCSDGRLNVAMWLLGCVLTSETVWLSCQRG